MSPKLRPIFEIWPELEPELGFLALGDFPTPIECLAGLVDVGRAPATSEAYVKRDDLSSPYYGGNKVRTLEPLFGQARREGHSTVMATGAYGSNHAVATVVHAQRVGLRAGIALFPQPYSGTAGANLRVSVTRADEVWDLLHWSTLPFAIWRLRHGAERPAPYVMPPGGAIPRGCLGFLSAALELAQQVQQGAMPPPDEIVIALGSTCSTAGMLVGLRVAERLGIGWGRAGGVPLLVAVRVTPWPVTSAFRILNLAERVSHWLFSLTRSACVELSRAELARGLSVDGSELGAGYGRPTAAGLSAIHRLGSLVPALDTTYSAKSAAALLARIERRPAVRLFWSTKSSAPLPPVSAESLALAPPRMVRWLERGGAAIGQEAPRGLDSSR